MGHNENLRTQPQNAINSIVRSGNVHITGQLYKPRVAHSANKIQHRSTNLLYRFL